MSTLNNGGSACQINTQLFHFRLFFFSFSSFTSDGLFTSFSFPSTVFFFSSLAHSLLSLFLIPRLLHHPPSPINDPPRSITFTLFPPTPVHTFPIPSFTLSSFTRNPTPTRYLLFLTLLFSSHPPVVHYHRQSTIFPQSSSLSHPKNSYQSDNFSTRISTPLFHHHQLTSRQQWYI